MTKTAGAAALLVLSGLLAACGGADDEPSGSSSGDSSENAEAESPDGAESDESAEAEESEDEITADTPPTAPDTVLAEDEPAVVRLPYSGGGRGLYAVDLVSVEEQPLSKLPPEVPADPGSTLVYVTQDWTMIDVGTGSVTGMNLNNHTSVSIGQDIQITSILFADPAGCKVQQFIGEDGDAGKVRRSCTAYLIPKGESVKEVWYFEFTSKFDFSTGGDPVRWRIDA